MMRQNDKPTHIVSLYEIKCYYNEENNMLWGISPFREKLLSKVIAFHQTLVFFSNFIGIGYYDEFPLKIIKKFD